MSTYDFQQIESKWQNYWESNKTFKALGPGDEGFDASKPKYYVLDMFPYPSGIGLHVGHPLGYIATDIVSRYKRMNGFNVLHPMGFDAFGLPAEQYAVEHGVHPAITTQQNIDNMLRQLKAFGLSYDWDRMISTTDPKYYKWTQWIFLQLYSSWYDPAKKQARPIAELVERLEQAKLYVGPDDQIIFPEFGMLEGIEGSDVGALKYYELDTERQKDVIDSQRLAFIAEVPVNWCPQLGTVLANEEVTNDGRSERGNYPVYRRPLKQWMLRITAYCERLIDDLDLVDWPDAIKMMQRNWIGKSKGATVDFPIENAGGEFVTVYTTRPDTLFGATYMVLAPEHPLVDEIMSEQQKEAVLAYREEAVNKSERERADVKEKTGVFTGAYAINPVNETRIPIWISDYVMLGYGTGAIMAVPAHDERDFEFAQKFKIPIIDVIHNKELRALSAVLTQVKNHPRRIEEGKAYVQAFVTLALTEDRDDFDHLWEALEDQTTREAWLEKQCPWAGLSKILETHNIDELIGRDETGRLVELTGEAMTGAGLAVNSANAEISLDDYDVDLAKSMITQWLEENNLGSAKTQYKLRDWLFSRQRYWGEPFPMFHTEEGELVPVATVDLPVELPEMEDFKPQGSDDPEAPPTPPLGRAPESWRVVEGDGRSLKRELNTMPQWAGSCWYYLRYIDPLNDEAMIDPAKEAYWMGDNGVDLYVGGAEHAVLHLLYSRFWHKVLFDLGHVKTAEPFGRLFNQGYIQAYCYRDQRGVAVPATEVVDQEGKPAMEVQDEAGREFSFNGEAVKQEYGKMGKSLKNAVNPDDIFESHGCDTLRLYEMYMGPLDQSKPWNTNDIVGPARFLQRIWRNFVNTETGDLLVTDEAPDADLNKLLHQTIKRVTEDMDRMAYNTAIAGLIELNNALVKLEKLPRVIAEHFVLMLAPMAPHIAEELWEKLGHDSTLAYENWPSYDESVLVESTLKLVVQIRGKVRGTITVPIEADEKVIMDTITQDQRLGALLEDKEIIKTIIVPGKLVNLVVR